MTKKKDKAQDKTENSYDTIELKSVKSSNISASSELIKQYGVDPVKTPGVLTYNAYKKIVGYGLRYANEAMSSKDWREVYGILIGSVEDNKKVLIKDAIPMIVGDRAGVKYENKQYVDMAQIDESVYERSIQDSKNDFIIGWWHTHPGFGFFYSPVDCMTQLGYQIPNPYALGIIFDHTKFLSNDFYLGVAGLRLINPEQGMLATYDLIELEYELEKEQMVKKVKKTIKDLNKNIDKILDDLKYIDEVLRKKALAQLQRNYGLILVPKKDIKVTKDEAEAEEDENYLYVWDPNFFKKSYRIPKFREKVENEIAKYEKIILSLQNDNDKYESKRQKYQKKIQSLLSKPNEWYKKMMSEFTEGIEKISPLYDYLDTNERKIIEHFETRSSEYYKILDSLNTRAEFEFKNRNLKSDEI
jgi:proteasome lid subunit RPN8/RPN11